MSGVKIISYSAIERPPLRNYLPYYDYGGILKPYDNLHEGHEYFGLRSNMQTLANLIIALAFIEINHSIMWNKEDLCDILKIGDKMYCDVIKRKKQCNDIKYQLKWNDLKPIIGVNHFKFERNRIKGIFKYLEKSKLSNENEENNIKNIENNDNKNIDNISYNKNDKDNVTADSSYSGNNSITETDGGGDSGVGDNETTKSPINYDDNYDKEEDEINNYNDLYKLLSNWEHIEKIQAILQSDIFDIAIWKQDGLYFIFDPKVSDDKGKLTEKRKYFVLDKIKKRQENENLVEEFGEDEEEEEKDEKESDDNITKQLTDNNQTITTDNKTNKTINENKFQEQQQQKFDIEKLSNNGSAYVAWFTHLEQLIDHILSKIPSEINLNNELLTLNIINIEPEIVNNELIIHEQNQEISNNNNLTNSWKYYINYYIIRGTISQNDLIFQYSNYQDIPNCIVSLSFGSISNPDKWTFSMINIILKYGDRLYTKSLQEYENKNKTKNNNINNNGSIKIKLTFDDIVKAFTIYKILFNWNLIKKDIGDLNDLKNFENNFKNLQTIESNNGCILLIKGYMNSLWKSNENLYYLFDPHETTPEGFITNNNGYSSITRFTNLNDLYEFLKTKYGCIISPNFYNIYMVSYT